MIVIDLTDLEEPIGTARPDPDVVGCVLIEFRNRTYRVDREQCFAFAHDLIWAPVESELDTEVAPDVTAGEGV